MLMHTVSKAGACVQDVCGICTHTYMRVVGHVGHLRYVGHMGHGLYDPWTIGAMGHGPWAVGNGLWAVGIGV